MSSSTHKKISKRCRTSIASQGLTREDPPVSVFSWCSKSFLAIKAKVGWNIIKQKTRGTGIQSTRRT
eukprot:8335801-Pyramimonas_sp.AAC.1